MATERKKTRRRKSRWTAKGLKKAVAAKKTSKKRARPRHQSKRRLLRQRPDTAVLLSVEQRGLGARAAGQSGDIQGLSGIPQVDSESVEELIEEGQAYEAEVLDGVERAPDPDEAEVYTREVPLDDVPEEYRSRG